MQFNQLFFCDFCEIQKGVKKKNFFFTVYCIKLIIKYTEICKIFEKVKSGRWHFREIMG